MYDLIIIGGGPAGMTAGIYAGRQKLKTLLITDGFGGQMAKKSVDIENYPGFSKISGLELVKNFENHLRSQEVEITIDKVIKLEKSEDGPRIFNIETGSGKKYESRSVIIAAGAESKTLEVPGEEQFLGKGVSYCPICDGPFFKNKTVVIVGGGNAGLEAASFLSNYVAKIYVLEFGEKLMADEINQNLIKNIAGLEMILNAELKEIKGTNRVEEISYMDRETGEVKIIKTDGVMVEIGYKPATNFISEGLVEYNGHGEVVADPRTMATKTEGLYAAGDIFGGICKQIVVAAADGSKAAISAGKFLKK